MVLELPTPGMEHGKGTDLIGTHETLVSGQLLQRTRGRLEQRRVAHALMAPEHVPQSLGHGERDQEVSTGQELLHPLVEPSLGLGLLTARTVAIATATPHHVSAGTSLALVHVATEVAVSAVDDGVDDLLVHRRHGIAVALEILGRVALEDLLDRTHESNPRISLLITR